MKDAEIPLSKREQEVLQSIAKGRSNTRISEELYLSVKTVETHRRNIMRKLNLHNAADLTWYALEHG